MRNKVEPWQSNDLEKRCRESSPLFWGEALRDGLDPVALLRERWTAFYAGDASVRPEAVTFFLDFVESWSDLDVRYLDPTDRLIGDLSFDARVHREWDLELYAHFKKQFGHAFNPALAPKHDVTLDEWIRSVSRALHP